MTKLKIKKITIDNWLMPDIESMQIKMTNRITGKTKALSDKERINSISKIILSESVPSQVYNLFEVAKGTLIYAYFYYPLYSLAAEQLFRVAETAVFYKCRELNAPKRLKIYLKQIEYLASNGQLNKTEKWRWDALRRLRNIGSHPEDQNLIVPNLSFAFFTQISRDINKLFK
ncbi:MAG: hypothetical protein IIB94_01775 [Candidatus Marinimicrobia bacterium]|nr:hypothetical protein [Candidatus Neomarinimicrobiota bacterium]